MNVYKRGDWSYWRENDPELVAIGYGRECFVRYTLRHKVRLLIGIHGNMSDRDYFFDCTSGSTILRKVLNFIVNLIPAL